MTGLRIRSSLASDADALAALNRYGLRAAGISLENEIYADENLSQAHQTPAGDRLLVGEAHGRVVAMGALRRIDDTTCELLRMRVAPKYQGRGYATDLLRELEAAAGEMGYRRITLITGVKQHPAIDLYARHGYEPIEYMELLGIASVRMSKGL